jgi:hypothetical protein
MAAMFQKVDPSAGFELLGGPTPVFHEIGDPVEVLPGEASRERLSKLRQRAFDSRAMWSPLADELHEQRVAKQTADVRLRQLTTPLGAGGPGLGPGDSQHDDIKRRVARIDAEIARLTTLEAVRGRAMNDSAMLVRDVENWLRRGSKLVEATMIEPGDVLKKGERIIDGVERLRHRIRELDADAHRVNSAPFPSADAKKRLREQIDSLANRGVPIVTQLIEHDGDVAWPQSVQTLPLVGFNKKDGTSLFGSAQGELNDMLALFAWLHRKQLVAALDGLIDSEADDSNALSLTDRETKLTEIARDRLMIERQESALVWHAQSNGDNVEHRADASPHAVLGVELRTAAA